MKTIDLNCDLGEGYGSDAELMNFVSSVNVACGYHAGDEETMTRTVELAAAKGISIGAHPSYPDRENFGRTSMELSEQDLFDIVSEQISTLDRICAAIGTKLSHVKPHGALYNRSAYDAMVAATIASVVRDIDPELILYGLSGSVSIIEAKEAGLRTASEVFADRGYRSDGSLVPRSEPGALLTTAADAADQALAMAMDGLVISVTGEQVAVESDTICIHGDGQFAVEFASAIRTTLLKHNIRIHPLNA